MFRGRIMIPLADPQGRIIGFTARLLEDTPNLPAGQAGAPKYLNTPQTPLYDKGRHVYGLHLAKEAIRKGGFSVLAEGNLDVVSSHQAGVKQVVATAGTALTEAQLKTLGRFAPDVRLAFDQDQAGLTAAERAIPIAQKAGVSLSIITIPGGKDPDELIQKDPKIWESIIQKPQYALDWLIERHAQALDLNTAPGKRQFSDIVLRVIRQLPDQVEQDHYMGEVAKRLDVSKEALTRKLQAKTTPTRLRQRKTSQTVPDSFQTDRRKAQNHFLALMLHQPALRRYLSPITGAMLLDEPAAQLSRFLKDNSEFQATAELPPELMPIADYVKVLNLQFEELYQGLELLELRNEATRLQVRVIEQYVKTQKQPLIEAMRTANETEAAELLEKAKKLDQLLKNRGS